MFCLSESIVVAAACCTLLERYNAERPVNDSVLLEAFVSSESCADPYHSLCNGTQEERRVSNPINSYCQNKTEEATQSRMQR